MLLSLQSQQVFLVTQNKGKRITTHTRTHAHTQNDAQRIKESVNGRNIQPGKPVLFESFIEAIINNASRLIMKIKLYQTFF